MPKVSVVIPCYDHARYLPEAVESVLRQTYADFEVIIVNDGSPDNTLEVAEGLIDKHPGVQIKLVNQLNLGPPGARNSGISLARGEYILTLDADDMIMPELLAVGVELLETNPSVSIAYTDMRYFGEVDDVQKDLIIGHDYDFNLLLKSNHLPVCSLFRKKAWEDVGGYKNEMSQGYEDWEFWVALGEAGHVGRRIRKPLFLYRVKGDSRYTESLSKYERICFDIRKIHRRTYYPFAGRNEILLYIANTLTLLKSKAKNSLKKFLYVNHPGLYRILKAKRDELWREA